MVTVLQSNLNVLVEDRSAIPEQRLWKAVLAQILPGLSLFSGGKQMELKVDGYIRAKAFGFGKKVPIHVNRNIDPGKLIKN